MIDRTQTRILAAAGLIIVVTAVGVNWRGDSQPASNLGPTPKNQAVSVASADSEAASARPEEEAAAAEKAEADGLPAIAEGAPIEATPLAEATGSDTAGEATAVDEDPAAGSAGSTSQQLDVDLGTMLASSPPNEPAPARGGPAVQHPPTQSMGGLPEILSRMGAGTAEVSPAGEVRQTEAEPVVAGEGQEEPSIAPAEQDVVDVGTTPIQPAGLTPEAARTVGTPDIWVDQAGLQVPAEPERAEPVVAGEGQEEPSIAPAEQDVVDVGTTPIQPAGLTPEAARTVGTPDIWVDQAGLQVPAEPERAEAPVHGGDPFTSAPAWEEAPGVAEAQEPDAPARQVAVDDERAGDETANLESRPTSAERAVPGPALEPAVTTLPMQPSDEQEPDAAGPEAASGRVEIAESTGDAAVDPEEALAVAETFGLIEPGAGLAAVRPGWPPEVSNVLFNHGSSYLSPGGVLMVDRAAATLAEIQDDHRVEIVGFTDTVGPADFNVWLAERRVNRVIDALVRRGIARDALIGVPRGPVEMPVPTADNVPEPLNRAVVVRLVD